MDQELLTAQQLAEKLGLAVETIWRYTRERKIPAITLGTRQYRYELRQVMQSLDTKTSPVKEAKTGPHTYDDYAALPPDPGYKIQLIDGCFVKEPGPVLQHQRVSRRLHRVLEDYFAQTNPRGELFNAPVDLVLSEYSTVQPDLVFVSDATKLSNPKYIEIVPKLIVEILSPSSRRTDTVRKLNLYRRHGVLHYWIVEPEEGIIQAYKLKDEDYMIVTFEDGRFEHPDFPDLSFNLAELVIKPSP